VKTIVVGYDGSEHAERALDRAIELATGGAEVVVLSAGSLAPPSLGGGSPVHAVGVEEARRNLDQAQTKLKATGVSARTVEAHGDAADMLVEQAKEAGADLIVVGTRGLNLAQRAVLGSVSTKVVHHAGCDVLVVR
jgi:nucleotide-binding universal stress UspA family protein